MTPARLRFLLSAIVPAIVITACSAEPARANDLQGRASVIDGDTIEIHGQRIRLFGLDAVESRQRCTRDGQPWNCGKDSAFALDTRIGMATIDCRGDQHDRYGRIIAVCFKGAEDLNRWMVEQGWAVAYRHYSLDYTDVEDQAKATRRGWWSSEFEMPWEWRKRTK